MRHAHRNGTRRARWGGGAIAALGVIALAGCGTVAPSVTPSPSDSLSPSASSSDLAPVGPPAPAPDPTVSAVDIAGSTFDIVDGRIVTPCFSFAVPAGYAVDDTSAQCSTAIRADENGLTDINVFAGKGLDSIDAFFEEVQKNATANGLGNVTTKRVTVQGRAAGVGYFYSAYGLPNAIYFIPIQEGYLTIDGEAINAITASGPIGDPNSAAVLQGILDSLEFPG
jgi:hypothetical protein